MDRINSTSGQPSQQFPTDNVGNAQPTAVNVPTKVTINPLLQFASDDVRGAINRVSPRMRHANTQGTTDLNVKK
jgi:hypothetical protein